LGLAGVDISAGLLSEQHPREQGLKQVTGETIYFANRLSEQHPREQGLKLYLIMTTENYCRTFRATSKRTRIETKLETADVYLAQHTFRATSKRTRIETFFVKIRPDKTLDFQSNIQENKD